MIQRQIAALGCVGYGVTRVAPKPHSNIDFLSQLCANIVQTLQYDGSLRCYGE